MGSTPCEACGQQMEPWQIARSCVLLRCPRCGHVVRDLERCPAGARSHPWGGNSTLDRIRIALTWRQLQTLLAGRGALDILEIGFGRGLLLERLVDAPDGHRLTGVDRGLLQTGVVESVRAAATLFDDAAENLRLPDGSLDLIYAIHVVEHLDDPAAVFANCRRMLREGGLLYLMTPNARSDGLRLFRDRWWNLEDPTHVRFFSPDSIRSMLGRAGFRSARVATHVLDSLTLEVSSVARALQRGGAGDEHGVLSNAATAPLYAVLTPVALAARAMWPALSPSMEVTARA